MAGGEPPDVVNRWSTSASGWKTRTEAHSFHRSSQQGAESLCGDYSSEDGSCSGWHKPGTPRAAGNLVSPRHSMPVTPRFTGSAGTPRHSQFRSPRGQSPRVHQSPREPGPLSIAFKMPLPSEGAYTLSDQPHMASAVDSGGVGMQQYVQSQERDTRAQRFEGRKVPLLSLSSLGLEQSCPESLGETHLHQQPLQMSGAMFLQSTHAEQRQAEFSHSEDGLTHDKRQQLGTECVRNATKPAAGSSTIGGDTVQRSAAVWSALEEAYCGSEDELQMSALHADTCEALANEYSPQGRSGVVQSSGSTGLDTSLISEGGTDSDFSIREPEEEESRISRAYSILGNIRGTIEQQSASALDATCTVLTGTTLPASLERKMVGLAIQDGTQQPDITTSLSELATFSASEAPGSRCHADPHDRPASGCTGTFSAQLGGNCVPGQLELPSPQQTPRVGLSTILDSVPDQARMLSNLPTLPSQQAGPSQHGDSLLWMGVNMLTADDVSARALAAAAAHPDAAGSQHSGGAFSLTSDLSPESEDSQLSLVTESNTAVGVHPGGPGRAGMSTAGVMIEGPTSAPDFGRTPLRMVPSSLTAQLQGKGPLGGRGLCSGTDSERVGAFWPEPGSIRRVIRQKEFLVEEEAEHSEDASERFFGEMSLSSGSEEAGRHDVSNSSSSSSASVSLTDAGGSDERSVYQEAVCTQPSALTSVATESMVPSMVSVNEVSAADLNTGAQQVMDTTSTQIKGATTKALDMTDPRVTQDARQSKRACAIFRELDAEAVGTEAEAFAEQDAAETGPSGAVQDQDIMYKLDKTVQQVSSSCTPPASQQRQPELATPSPDRSCWSPSLGPMLEETVGLLFTATPVKKLSGGDDI